MVKELQSLCLKVDLIAPKINTSVLEEDETAQDLKLDKEIAEIESDLNTAGYDNIDEKLTEIAAEQTSEDEDIVSEEVDAEQPA
jgi:hypothetical protein